MALLSAIIQDDLIRQAAHDIRSPLSVLNIVLKSQMPQMSCESKQLMELAILRINEIATDILAVSKRPEDNHQKWSLANVADIAEVIVKEKKALHSKASLELNLIAESNDVMAQISVVPLTRILSNIIDNAIEAVSGAGIINIKILDGLDFVQIEISDNGEGISQDRLTLIGKKGITFKKNGHGFGLFSTKLILDELGGHLNVGSVLGEGTKVIIRIPAATANK